MAEEKPPRAPTTESQLPRPGTSGEDLRAGEQSVRENAELAQEEVIAEFRAYLERYSGPLPPPHLLAQYRQISPEALEWIFRSATREQEHRHWREREPLRQSARGQYFAFIIAVLGILLGGWLIYLDKPLEGFTALLVPLASILGIFIYREIKASRSENPSDKVSASE